LGGGFVGNKVTEEKKTWRLVQPVLAHVDDSAVYAELFEVSLFDDLASEVLDSLPPPE
jgi:hypothetical protein